MSDRCLPAGLMALPLSGNAWRGGTLTSNPDRSLYFLAGRVLGGASMFTPEERNANAMNRFAVS